MPSVSFILPAYKRRYLHEAIASILAQTYTDFELVVVDDCSPEDLKSVVDEFHDARLTYHRNAENLGGKDLVAAWNHALEYAHGEWVVCAGDDDVYDPDYLKEMLVLAVKYPEVDVLHCRLVFIDGEGKITGLGKPRTEIEKLVEVIYHSSIDRLDQRIPEFMYRRSTLLKNGGYAASPRAWYSDIMTSIIMSQAHGAVFVDKFLLRWRLSDVNISGRHDDVPDKIEATVLFVEWIMNLVKNIEPLSLSEKLMLDAIRTKVDEVALQALKGYWLQIEDCQSALEILKQSHLENKIKERWQRERRDNELRRGKFSQRCKRVLLRIIEKICQ